MGYQFAGTLFDSRNDAIQAVAEAFVGAGGMNSAADIQQWLSDPEFPSQAAREALSDWDCNIAQAGAEPEYPTEDELADAISELDASDFE